MIHVAVQVWSPNFGRWRVGRTQAEISAKSGKIGLSVLAGISTVQTFTEKGVIFSYSAYKLTLNSGTFCEARGVKFRCVCYDCIAEW